MDKTLYPPLAPGGALYVLPIRGIYWKVWINGRVSFALHDRIWEALARLSPEQIDTFARLRIDAPSQVCKDWLEDHGMYRTWRQRLHVEQVDSDTRHPIELAPQHPTYLID